MPGPGLIPECPGEAPRSGPVSGNLWAQGSYCMDMGRLSLEDSGEIGGSSPGDESQRWQIICWPIIHMLCIFIYKIPLQCHLSCIYSIIAFWNLCEIFLTWLTPSCMTLSQFPSHGYFVSREFSLSSCAVILFFFSSFSNVLLSRIIEVLGMCISPHLV